jgi:O-acetyl-ADP-ribose deacetylase (regulator of RNase III)
MRRTIGSTTIENLQGDIAAQSDVHAVVNAANAQLMPGGGVAGAIHRAAGPGLAKECEPLAPIQPGEAVITDAHNLPNDRVIHCLGPVYGADKPEDTLLARCYQNALALAEQEGLHSVAFPSISTGAFGYPMEEAAAVAYRTLADTAEALQSVQLIRIVLFGKKDVEIHDRVMQSELG